MTVQEVPDTVAMPRELLVGVVELCFSEMPRYYRGGTDAVIEWRLEGPAGGRWQLVLRDGRCEVHREGGHRPDVQLEASTFDFVAVCLGQADPRRLALRRRIRARGNLLMAARMSRWFRPPQAAGGSTAGS
jgi:predicted lipid carrier protein YhbT